MKKIFLLVLVGLLLSLIYGLPSFLVNQLDMYTTCFTPGDCSLWRVLT